MTGGDIHPCPPPWLRPCHLVFLNYLHRPTLLYYKYNAQNASLNHAVSRSRQMVVHYLTVISKV